MLKYLLALLVTTLTITAQEGPTQGRRPPFVQLTESQRTIGKVMSEDPEIKKIREKAIDDMIKRLVSLGHSQEDVKVVVENGAKAAERFRAGIGRPGRSGGPSGDRPQR